MGRTFWGSLAAHLVLLALCALFLRFGPEPGTVPAHRPAPPTVQYFSLDWPGSAAGDPFPPHAPPAAIAAPASGAAAPSAAPQKAERKDEQELRFPTRVPRGISPAPSGAGVPAAATPASGGSEAGVGSAGGQGTLNTGFSDPRLYVDPDAIIGPDPKQSDIERYRAHLRARIKSMNDSSYAAGSHPNTDWTVKGKDGSSWGIGPDGIHLGKVTIPRALIPIPTTGTAAGAQESARKAEQAAEVRRQGEMDEIREQQQERIKAIRARKGAEREKAEAPKDTTKSGG